MLVGALLATSAWLLEGALRLHVRPSRWIWIVALMATTLLVGTAPLRRAPASAVRSLAAATPTDAGSATIGKSMPGILGRVEALFSAALAPLDDPFRELAATLPDEPQRVDRVLAIGWMAGSGVLLLVFGSTLLRISRERRRWPFRHLHGTAVRIAPAAGPMVAGVLHPDVVVPEWLLHAPDREQRLVLAHEREHVRGRDPLLLAGGALLVVLLPWNPAVWWMAARLRLAVEVDCDRRVLRGGANRADYSSTLLEIATRRTGGFFPAPPCWNLPANWNGG